MFSRVRYEEENDGAENPGPHAFLFDTVFVTGKNRVVRKFMK
jgi:hypothetical protein